MTNIPPLVSTSSAFRTSTNSRINIQLSNIRRSLNKMIETEIQLSSGYRVNVPSDDPLAAIRSLANRRQIEQGEQFQRNISLARAELQASDDALATLGDIVVRAREVYLSAQNAVTGQARANAALEVDRLVKEAVEVVNRKFQGRYLFGGRDGSRPPVEFVGRFIHFLGSEQAPEVRVAPGESVQRNITGPESFGGLSAQILGDADLDPILTPATKLADLNGGMGVRPGSIQIFDGTGLQRVLDLSGAETVEDVLNIVNADGIVSASINAGGDGLDLFVTGGNITVTEVNGGHTAVDLGILDNLAGPTLAGTDLDPVVRLTTPLADLRGGAGFDTSGITITNGDDVQTLDFSAATTVEDLLNTINLADIYLKASINPGGNGIDLRSSLNGARFTVSENGGTTARDLGLLLEFAELGLDHVNSGLGISTVQGDDLEVQARDGSSFRVDVSAAVTVQDVVDLFNTAAADAGIAVTASVPPGQNRLEIQDATGGTGELSVSPANGSLAAQTLGIFKTVNDPASSLTGEDLKPAGQRVDSLFDTLLVLREALVEPQGIELDLLGGRLERVENGLIDARAELGVRISRIEFTEARLQDEKLRLQTLISEDREVNLAEAVVEFERNRALLDASYAATSQVLSLSLLDFLR